MLKEYSIEDVGSYGCIYKLTSPSGKCYIGQTWDVKQRFKVYKFNSLSKNQAKLYNAIKKYKGCNFKYEILDLCETQLEMDNKEIFYIEMYDSVNNGYNIRAGGNGGGKLSEETKKKLSENNWLKNGKCTEEYRKIMAIACSGEKNGFYNKKHSTKTKKYLSKKFKGQKLPQSQIENIRKGHIGIKFSESCKENLSKANSKYVYELEYPNGEKITFNSLAKFCKEHNIVQIGLWRVIKGRYSNYKGMKIKIIKIFNERS